MISSLLKKTTVPLLTKHLDLSGINRRVINHNIANVNTVGYLNKEMSFDDTLQESARNVRIATTQQRHMRPGGDDSVEIVESADRTIKNGINNVDIDEEMVKLSNNQMEAQFSITMLARFFKGIKSVIKEQPG